MAGRSLQGRSGTVCAVLALTLLAALGLRGSFFTFAVEREVWWLKASGYLALGALFLSLSMTPLFRLRRRLSSGSPSAAPWLAFRRSFGITAAALALVHGAVVLATYLQDDWKAVLTVPYLRAGMVALAILLALLLTSFPSLNRRLSIRLWKELHRLSYVAAVFLAQHLLLSPFAPRRRVLLLFALLVAVGLLRLLPDRRRARKRRPGAGRGLGGSAAPDVRLTEKPDIQQST